MDRFTKIFRQYFQIILILILLFFAVNLSSNLSEMRLREFPVNLDRPQGIQIFTEMIGEVRTIIASYIYIRAEMYHHERESKIDWRQDAATLPLHRLVTALNPKFVKAYDFGAYQLAVNLKKTREAIKFLREGLHYNPDSYDLHFTMGNIYYTRKDYSTAIKWHKKALKLAKERVDIANCLRRLYWENRKIGNYEEAKKYITILRQEEPDLPVNNRYETELEQLISGEKTEEDFDREKELLRERLIKENKEKMLKEDEEHNHDDENDDHHYHKHDHHNH